MAETTVDTRHGRMTFRPEQNACTYGDCDGTLWTVRLEGIVISRGHFETHSREYFERLARDWSKGGTR